MIDYQELLKRNRKKPLSAPESFTALDWGREEIKLILPHRDPFLLLDRLTGVNFPEESLSGSRALSPEDPIFAGHFPEFPVYPGCLEVEMIGQLGLCLSYFLRERTTTPPSRTVALNVRASRILGATYLEPVLPGKEVRLLARKLEADEYFASVLGQVLVDEKVACVAVLEVCFVEEPVGPV
ncbi:MAG: 3-hydroxyacyl-ACP dehydratase FabZ family protein [Spirochaetia bacterium]